MTLLIAGLVVVVLLAVALLPNKRGSTDAAEKRTDGTSQTSSHARQRSLREQQLREEADAICAEYCRRADEVWLGEVREKAAGLLGLPK